MEESKTMLDVYTRFVENFMAIPVVQGVKTPSERFAGAEETFCIEALMQDGKALQAGTSHFLGQNFAKAFDVKFASKEGTLDYVWATSWGVSTRLIGALIMTHSDDNGLVLPPNLAPIQVVIIPIYKNEEQQKAISETAVKLAEDLRKEGISVKFDDDDKVKPGWKFNEYELKGVPLRIAIGPRDLENGQVELARRDTLEKSYEKLEGLPVLIKSKLDEIQKSIFSRALDFRSQNTREAATYEEFKEILETKAGFISAYWDGSAETEEKIKDETKATIRCIPFEDADLTGKFDFYSSRPAKFKVLYAKAY
jgi:prolyl-tRNA synthetase